MQVKVHLMFGNYEICTVVWAVQSQTHGHGQITERVSGLEFHMHKVIHGGVL